MSSLFLHEGMGLKQILGMLVVVAGGFLLSVKRVEGGMFRPRASLWLMLLSSVLYGLVNILFRFVAHGADISFWSILAYEYIGKGIGGFALLLIPQIRGSVVRQFQMIKKSVGILAINDSLNIIAEMSESFALTLATVPMVNIVGAVQPFMTLTEGLALTLFFPHIIREDISKTAVAHKLISIALMFAGLYLVFA
jgi:drug/metabolite transporter (DMT)-like permease